MTKETNSSAPNSNTAIHNERLSVAVRVRPVEIFRDGQRALSVLDSQNLVLVESGGNEKSDLEHFVRHGTSRPNNRLRDTANKVNGSEGKIYEFDHVFNEKATQEDVYKHTAAPLVRSVLDGFCATVFAYGATGSGKTHTMIGSQGNPGIMARSVDEIFQLSASQSDSTKTDVYLSYLEVYNEQIRDLLRPVPGIHLDLREDKDQVHVAGLHVIKATSTHEVLNLLQKGNKARTMEATAANVTSSRSHAVLLVTVRQTSVRTGSVTEGKLYLIDLAGSERASNTKNSGIRLREGAHINRSLLALGNCITALASGDGDRYVNYRDSKLTRLLKAALGGPSKTAMIAHVTPTMLHREETRNTLLYAQRARAISNRVRKFIFNPGQSPENNQVIQELRNEVKRLQMKLSQQKQSEAAFSSSNNSSKSSSHNSTPSLPDDIFPKNYDRPDLSGIKKEIQHLFDEEFRLRNDLLKMDGAMLQSALDCEILRLMVLDWENLKSKRNSGLREDSDGETTTGEESELGRQEIQSVMSELKVVRHEQDKLLTVRTDVETELKSVRGRIAQVEEDAMNYLPETQREILSLLCKLQQEQVNKMSVEIEAELKRRGTLLLRCLRQKALGEAIIHRQRHFLHALSSGYHPPKTPIDSAISGRRAFLPPLTKPGSSDRLFQTPPSSKSIRDHLPPLTTKYAEFRKSRYHRRRSSSDEDDDL